MSNDREEMIKSMYREQQAGKGAKYNYVNTEVAERLGIHRYVPEMGTNFIRIVSPIFNGYDKKPFYGKKLAKHTNTGADQRTYLCMMKTYGERCAICDHAEATKSFKTFKPIDRCLFLVYNVADASTIAKNGLMWFDAPVTFLRSLTNQSIVTDRVTKQITKVYDFSDPKLGSTIEFKAEKKVANVNNQRTEFTNYEIVRLIPEEIPANLLNGIPNDFEELLIRPDYDTVKGEISGMSESTVSQVSAPQAPAQAPVAATGGMASRFASAPAQAPVAPTAGVGLNPEVKARLAALGAEVG
jgi:hypothetical protein